MSDESSSSEDQHEWFNVDGFRLDTERYGTVELFVTDTDHFVEDDYRGEPTRWIRDFALEGECGDDKYRSFSASLSQEVGETDTTLAIREMVAPDEWEDIEYSTVEAIYDE